MTARNPRSGRKSGMRTLGYASVPGGTALDSPELEAQVAGIEAGCEDLGLNLVSLVRDHEYNGEDARPGLSQALKRIDAGDASCLIVSDLERLSREVGDLASVVQRLERGRARLIALDVGLDTATPSGRLAITPHGAEGATVESAPAEAPHDAEKAVEVEPADAPHDAEEAVEVEPADAPHDAEEAVEVEPTDAPHDAEEATVEPVEATPAADVVSATDEPGPADAGANGTDQPERPLPTLVRALGYASVPAEGGAGGLDEQKRAIERDAKRLGFEIVEVVGEREPKTGGALDRAGLSYVIERIAAGDAKCIVVSALDKLSRSVADLGTIVQWLERNDVRLVAVDIGLDTASPGGHATVRALASVARWEHERLSERTRSGLAAARAKRHAGGRGSEPDWTEIRQRIAKMRADGMTLQAIADKLNAERIPTQRGGAEWRPSSVQTAAGYKRRSRPKNVEDLPTVERPGPP
jgi:DNA invertase Pin-like site-specific DNA recombinase